MSRVTCRDKINSLPVLPSYLSTNLSKSSCLTLCYLGFINPYHAFHYMTLPVLQIPSPFQGALQIPCSQIILSLLHIICFVNFCTMIVCCIGLLMDQGKIQGLKEILGLKAMFRLSFYMSSKDGRDEEKQQL